MKPHEHRGVSLGTIVMLMVTLAVLFTSASILPRLMGKANISIEELAMRSSVNMNNSLPSLVKADIPIANATEVPPMTEATLYLQPVETTAAILTPEASATPEPVSVGTVSLTFGGSIVVDDLIRKSGYYADSETYDYSDHLSLIAQELESDLTMVTIEAVTDPNGNIKEMPNAPATVMGMLKSGGVDVAALGYARSADLGLNGLCRTIDEVQRLKLDHIGTYASEEDAARLRIYTIDNVSVALLHYTGELSVASRRKLQSEDAGYAITVASLDDASKIAADIHSARNSGADIVIVSLNWSAVSSFNPAAAKMKAFMQAIADAGADVIVGAGTKTVRELTWIMGKRSDGTTRQTLCAWSLGSLLNGERKDGNVTGMLLHLQLSFNGSTVSFERVTYTPTYIWRYKQDGQWRYRVVASDLSAPDGMDNTQAANAVRSFENLKKTLGNSPVTLRIP